MNEADAYRFIRERVKVTPQLVAIAKGIVARASERQSRTSELVDNVLKVNAVSIPHQVVLHQSVDPIPSLTAAAEGLSWQLAAQEAIWSLIHGGILLSMGNLHGSAPNIGWTTVVPGSGGQSSGWRFEDLYVPVPALVRRAPSFAGANDQFLSEPDLYLNTLAIPNMHPDVRAAFYEAVRCFRGGLFTAAVAMLGKASEGAWLELGAALLGVHQGSDFKKQRAVLEDPQIGTGKKIDAVLAIFERQDIFRPVSEKSGVRPQELKSVSIWSDAVRDSRNTIHFGVTPATPNTYEKVATLLVGAVPHARVLYQVKDAADSHSGASGP